MPTSSMADIAFLLLIFFMVTTTITTEKGILVKLPPWDVQPPRPLAEQNVFTVKVNARNDIFAEGEKMELDELRAATKAFLQEFYSRKKKHEVKGQAVVSLMHDRGTTYKTYLGVYNELSAAFRKQWEAEATRKYGQLYSDLSRPQQEMVRKALPLIISEAEPTAFE